MKAGLKTRMKTEVAAHAVRQAAGKLLFQDLSGIPQHLRAVPQGGGKRKNPLRNNDLLIAKRADLATQLPAIQTKAAVDGLARMSKRKERPVIRLRLSPAELRRLGLANKDGEVTGTLKPKVLHEFMSAAVKGGVLTRVRGGVAGSSLDELERRYLLARRESPPPPNVAAAAAVAAAAPAKPPAPAKTPARAGAAVSIATALPVSTPEIGAAAAGSQAKPDTAKPQRRTRSQK